MVDFGLKIKTPEKKANINKMIEDWENTPVIREENIDFLKEEKE